MIIIIFRSLDAYQPILAKFLSEVDSEPEF